METKNNHISQKVTAATLLVALGIIYGDIGTSPLYALRAVIGNRKIEEVLVYGGVSAIFWTLVIQTSIKYIWLTLKADNQGEGGIFSLYALVKRYGKHLVIPATLGATTLLADGIITPPITVASAVEGLNMVKGFETTIIAGNELTIGIVIAILSLLFFFQRFGTEIIGRSFGPVMFLWFTMLFIMGTAQILTHPQILKVLNPYYAYQMLVQYPKGFWLLGSVFLCTTGAEALYSDLGHCGLKNIRISWIYVKISLVACYLGQAAWLMNYKQPYLSEGVNPFFGILPHWFLLPGVLLATAASIIASQALISGSYTLISEAMNLNFWPRIAVRQPSETKGQMYIPSVNNILWFGCILMVLYFKSSEHMEAAYGFSITITMLMTTLLLYYFLRFRQKWNKYYVALIISLFVIVETAFFVANIVKIKNRWQFLIFEVLIYSTMYIWFNSRKILNRFTKFVELAKYTDLLIQLSNDDNIPKFSTHLVYLTKADKRHQVEEKIIKSIFAKKPKRADVYWLLHVNRTNEPYTISYDVNEILDDKLIKINLNIGFRIQAKTEYYFKKIISDLVKTKELNINIRPDGSTPYNDEPDMKFVVIEKFLSIENEFALREGILLNSYFFLKKISLNDTRFFGLEKSDVIVEETPLIYQPIKNLNLVRNEN